MFASHRVMAAHRPKETLQRKVVWQEKGEAAAEGRSSDCPMCGAPGSNIDRTATKAYFVCPDCQCTWQFDLRTASR